ncbi:LCP family protein [Nonomuraea sediminis]|uniref:LCP family protein n=1 Tax=Nonomuraea sediminis TaxID=2835864 RepID=UPI001BDC0879|nr:LCP family protein [Nonomuraea sediminis]
METGTGLAAAIGWTLASIVVPGAAHLRAGHRMLGLAIFAIFLVVVSGIAVFALSLGDKITVVLSEPSWIPLFVSVCFVGGGLWAVLVVASYAVMRPRRGTLRRVGDLVALVTTLAVIAPFVVVARAARTVEATLSDVFASPLHESVDHADPWRGRPRINILLLGGDGAGSRKGSSIRTDSVNVASVDTRTGATVLFALPRELENVPFPPGSVMAGLFPPPKGFYMPPGQGRGEKDLLNAIWEYADLHPEPFHNSPTRAPDALMGAVGQILGLKLDYYVLVNMWGLAKLIDALGGVRIHVEQDICYGVGRSDGGTVKAGTRLLNGAEALWYGRARDHDGSTCAGGDNHTRMRRQHCIMSAMLHQLDPGTVLWSFEQLADAARQTFRTDIPRARLQDLIPLAGKVKNARVTTLSFVPPAYNPAYPDFDRIRADAADAIAHSGDRARDAADGLHPHSARPSPAQSRLSDLSDSCSR